MSNLIAGRLEITVNGKVINAVGSFTLNLGRAKREFLVGHDRVHGYKELPQVPSIKGEIRDSDSLDIVNDVLNLVDATIVAHAANGKQYVFTEATYTADGDIETEEGKVQFECQAMSADEVR